MITSLYKALNSHPLWKYLSKPPEHTGKSTHKSKTLIILILLVEHRLQLNIINTKLKLPKPSNPK